MEPCHGPSANDLAAVTARSRSIRRRSCTRWPPNSSTRATAMGPIGRRRPKPCSAVPSPFCGTSRRATPAARRLRDGRSTPRPASSQGPRIAVPPTRLRTPDRPGRLSRCMSQAPGGRTNCPDRQMPRSIISSFSLELRNASLAGRKAGLDPLCPASPCRIRLIERVTVEYS